MYTIIALVVIVVVIAIYFIIPKKFSTTSETLGYFNLENKENYWAEKYPLAVEAIKNELIKQSENPAHFLIKFEKDKTEFYSSNSFVFTLKDNEGKERMVVYNADLKTVKFFPSEQSPNYQRAKEQALAHLEPLNSSIGSNLDRFTIQDDISIEKEFGWVFFYQSEKYLETKDPKYLVPGMGPIVVNKDYTVIRLSSSMTPERSIDQYEKIVTFIIKANSEVEKRGYKPSSMDITILENSEESLALSYTPRALQLGGDITIRIHKKSGTIEKVLLER